MGLKDMDLHIQKSNPHHYQVLKGHLAGLDFDLTADFIYDTGRPATNASRQIRLAAGNSYDQEIRQARKEQALKEGYAIVTGSGDLHAQRIIHMIVPLSYHDGGEFLEFLWSCYWNCMTCAYKYLLEHHISHLRIAFDVMEGLSPEACTQIIRSISKMYRLYPYTRAISAVFVCSDPVSYTNLKEAVHHEKYS